MNNQELHFSDKLSDIIIEKDNEYNFLKQQPIDIINIL